MTFFMWVLQIQTQTLLLVQWTFLLTEPSSHPPFWSYIGFVLAPGFASKQPWTSAPIVWLLACKMQCLSHPVLQLSPHSARLEYLLHVWWTTHCVSNQSPTASSPCQQNILRLLRCKILLVCAWKTQPRFNRKQNTNKRLNVPNNHPTYFKAMGRSKWAGSTAPQKLTA